MILNCACRSLCNLSLLKIVRLRLSGMPSEPSTARVEKNIVGSRLGILLMQRHHADKRVVVVVPAEDRRFHGERFSFGEILIEIQLELRSDSGFDPANNSVSDCTQAESTNAANRISATETGSAFAVRDRLSGISSSLAWHLPADHCGLRTRTHPSTSKAREDRRKPRNKLASERPLAGALLLVERGFPG